MTDTILSSPPSSILASIERGPRPLVRVHWCRQRASGRPRAGRGDLVPIDVGYRVADAIVSAGEYDAWIVVEGRVG